MICSGAVQFRCWTRFWGLLSAAFCSSWISMLDLLSRLIWDLRIIIIIMLYAHHHCPHPHHHKHHHQHDYRYQHHPPPHHCYLCIREANRKALFQLFFHFGLERFWHICLKRGRGVFYSEMPKMILNWMNPNNHCKVLLIVHK